MGTTTTSRRRGEGRRSRTAPSQNDLARRIREALLLLGGEAHRATVIAAVAREFGMDDRHIPDDLAAAMIVSFEETWKDETARAAYGFHLRFGEGSHRWGVLRDVAPANSN